MLPQQLDEKFSHINPVKSLKISLDEDHTSRGYGFITYETAEDAQTALQLLSNED